MPTVFTQMPIGTVVRLADTSKKATVGFIKVEGKGTLAGFTTHKSIITAWSIEENVNVQFTHTMGNDIYLNVFGNRMGVATVTGLAFNSTSKNGNGCDGGGNHGILKIIDWYRNNRVSEPSESKITIQISDAGVISGYLIGAGYRSTDAENWSAEYTMQIATVPR